MMSYFTKILGLPEICVENSHLPKNFFEKKFKLSAAETKMLKVPYLPERIMWMASIKPRNTSIPVYVSDKEAYTELQVFIVQILAEHYEAYADRLIHLLHKHVPYHSVVVVHDQQRYQLSCGTQSINQVTKDKRVLEQVYISPVCSLAIRDDRQSTMEQCIRFDTISHVNLKSMYTSYIDAIIRAKADEVFGEDKQLESNLASNPLQLWAAIRKAKSDAAQINALKEKIRKAQTLPERVKLQMELRALKTSNK